MFTRTKATLAPEVGAEAPEFNLPSAQGGQLRLSMRTVRGPVAVIFYRPWSEEDVEYFKEIAGKEDEINMAAGSVVGIGIAEPDEAREFVRASGIKSYLLYDYVKVTSRQWGLLRRDKERGDYSRPAVFIVGADHSITHAWLDGRPGAEEILAKVSELTGLPKPAEEPEEKDAAKEAAADESAEGETKSAPKKLSAEEREKIKAERRAAREAGKSLKTPNRQDAPSGDEAKSDESGAGDGAPKKMSKEERDRIKAERRAAREAGKSLKSGAPDAKPEAKNEGGPEEPPSEGAKETSTPESREPNGEPESEVNAPSPEAEAQETEAQAETPDAESGAGDAAESEETVEERPKGKSSEGE